jgi:hypothetical protein
MFEFSRHLEAESESQLSQFDSASRRGSKRVQIPAGSQREQVLDLEVPVHVFRSHPGWLTRHA